MLHHNNNNNKRSFLPPVYYIEYMDSNNYKKKMTVFNLFFLNHIIIHIISYHIVKWNNTLSVRLIVAMWCIRTNTFASRLTQRGCRVVCIKNGVQCVGFHFVQNSTTNSKNGWAPEFAPLAGVTINNRKIDKLQERKKRMTE